MNLRPAERADAAFVRDLSAEAFAPFGDYRELLPRWTVTPGVHVWIAQAKGVPLGFAMVAFYSGDGRATWSYADLLAIAVRADARGRGVGRTLLRQAIETARLARDVRDVREIRLTVADTNERARRLFESEGFVVCNENHGRYDGGQRALRMRLALGG